MNWQEKMQTIAPPPKEQSNEWVEPSAARVTNPQTSLQMPPGYNAMGPMDSFTPTLMGETSPSDKAMQLESEASLKRGYGKGHMEGTDDMYTGEHADQFYSDAGGFVERGNVLDRM